MAFVVTAWKKDTSGTSITVATSLAAHDVAIAWGITDGTLGSFTWPSGFTELKKQVCTADSQTLAIALKTDCTGSEGTLTLQCNEAMVGGIIGISGGDNTTQPDVTTPTPGNNNTAQASAWTITASITPTTNGSLIVALMGSDITTSSASAVTHTFSDTGSLSWITQANSNDGGFIKGGIGTATQTTAAATTVTGTGTLAGKSAGRSLILVAVRPASGSDVTLALTGQAVTTSAGTLTPSTSLALTGQAVTASAGTLTYSAGGDLTLALSGQAVMASAGNLTPSLSKALSGSAVTVSAGTLLYSASITMAGQAVTTSAGILTPSMTIGLNGISVTASAGFMTATGGDPVGGNVKSVGFVVNIGSFMGRM